MYPLLSKLPAAPTSLTPQLRTILLAAGHVAAGDAEAAVHAFQHIEAEHRAKAYELAILQAMPFIGIPRVLHSANALQTAGFVGTPDAHMDDATCTRSQRHKGEETFAAVYGPQATRVATRLAGFHPALRDWTLSCTYGALLSRDTGATLRERELTAVAVLCGDVRAAPQLASHARGALRVGAAEAEVGAVVGATRVVFGAEAAEVADATWRGVRERARRSATTGSGRL